MILVGFDVSEWSSLTAACRMFETFAKAIGVIPKTVGLKFVGNKNCTHIGVKSSRQERVQTSQGGNLQWGSSFRTAVQLQTYRRVFLTFRSVQIQPENSTSEWQSAVLSLQEADEMVRVLVLFTTACNRLETCAAAKSANKFAELAQELAEVKRVLAELGREERYGLKVISSLKAMRMELQSALTTTVEAEWNNLIVVRKDTIDPAENTEVIGIQMNLSSGTNRPYSAVLEDVTQCAKSLRIFDRFAQELAEGLLEGVVAPVMDGRATVRGMEVRLHGNGT